MTIWDATPDLEKGEDSPEPPRWTFDLIGASGNGWDEVSADLTLKAIENHRFSLVSARVRGAATLNAASFQQHSTAAYEFIAERLRRCHAAHPVRLWNFIPGILAPLGDLPHRYMVFNAGRFEAFTHWLGSRDDFDRCMATASGVGHTGNDLVIHCLAASDPGRPVENPRQTSAYRYSERYGPLPPCFARATRLSVSPSRFPWLLVGGTASVHGEESMHRDDLDAQANETFQNLASVVRAGLNNKEPATRLDDREAADMLGRLRYLRVYYVHQEHFSTISRLIAERFPNAQDVEYVHAELCRPELLVEIEGVAELIPVAPQEQAA